MWERACSRKRCASQCIDRLTRRLREQARSHRGSVVLAWNVCRTVDSCAESKTQLPETPLSKCGSGLARESGVPANA
ncbi:hypothetical protein DA482_00955 [Pseudomonas fluorescens]|nr:hypothetical protein FIP59_15850 [Pseudomonas fluorescens]